MKVTSLNVLLADSFIFSQMTVSSALKCGQWNTHACLGDTDKRYDPDYTNDIKKQDELWEKMDGFYRVTQTSSSQPARFNPYDLSGTVSLPYDDNNYVCQYNCV